MSDLRIGIMSDSHGNVARMRAALARFDESGADVLIHCGDVGGIEIFELWAGRSVHFVWGNCDVASPGIREFLRRINLKEPPIGGPLRLTLGGARIVVAHGHEDYFSDLVARPGADYLLHGHTHARRDELRGATRVVNPGALHRTPSPSVALLEARSGDLSFVEPI